MRMLTVASEWRTELVRKAVDDRRINHVEMNMYSAVGHLINERETIRCIRKDMRETEFNRKTLFHGNRIIVLSRNAFNDFE